MKLRIKRLSLISISLFLSLVLLLPGCRQAPEPTPSSKPTENQTLVYTASSAPSGPIKVTLSLTGSPMLSQPVLVTATFALREWKDYVAKNATANITLGRGLELVDGDLEWQGDLIPGKPVEIKATIRAVATGDWRIEARAFYHPNETDWVGGTAYLYALVYKDHATVSPWPTRPTEVPHGIPMPPPTEKPPKPTPSEGHIAPDIGTLPPIEIPVEKPSEGDNITPKSLSPPSSSSLPSGGATLANPLVVTGGFNCKISENALPSPDQQRSDEVRISNTARSTAWVKATYNTVWDNLLSHN